jgi:hypothetical protein
MMLGTVFGLELPAMLGLDLAPTPFPEEEPTPESFQWLLLMLASLIR